MMRRAGRGSRTAKAGASVDARRAKGVYVGDYGTQINYFGTFESVSWPVRVGALPALADCYQVRALTTTLKRGAEALRPAPITQVLTGLGGVGKSQLAAAYARSCADTVDLVLWVTATRREAVLAAYAQAVAQLGLHVSDDVEVAAGRFQSWMQTTDRSWLVVLDDVADPADLQGLWPEGPRGCTLVTTRRTDSTMFGRGRRRISVGLFTQDEARRYLTAKLEENLSPDAVKQVDDLAADLGYLPLALAQAAAFMLNRNETCAEYRTRFADRSRRLSEVFPTDALADDYRLTIAVTWSISIEAADHIAPIGTSHALLQLLSVLDPNGVPADLLRTKELCNYILARRATAMSGAYPSQTRDGAAVLKRRRWWQIRRSGQASHCDDILSERDCLDALQNLARLSLVTIDAGIGLPGVIRIHGLVQRASTDELDVEELRATARAAATALMESWPDVENDSRLGQLLRANAAILTTREESALWEPDAHLILARVGRSLGECGLVAAAAEYWVQMVRDASQHWGPDDPRTLDARSGVAYWRGHTGDFAGARAAFEELLADRLRIQGTKHPATLKTRGSVARWCGHSGDQIRAVEELEQLLPKLLRLLGPDDPEVLVTRSNLAFWQGEAGDPTKAVPILEELQSDQVRVLGPDDRDTLTTRHNIAYFRGRAGDPSGAANAFKQLVADYLRVLGPDHPETLLTRGKVARWEGEAGFAVKAAAGFEELLTDYLRVLGPDHPDTMNTRGSIARWRGEAGDGVGAIRASAQLLADHIRVLGPDHPDTLTSRHNLAFLRGSTGDPACAAAALSELLSDYLRILGPDHPDIRLIRHNLAHWRRQTGPM